MKYMTAAAFVCLTSAFAGSAYGQPAQTIIVVGGKTPRPLEDTPSSVAVTRQSDIAAEGLRSLSDVVARSVNVGPVYGASGFSVRGIANTGVSGAGEADTANIYVDNVPLAATYLEGAPTDLWDVEQVELWRGPQSTLRGQNALAGAVIIETVDPSLDRWSARSRAFLDGDGDRGLAFAGGGPLASGTLAGRIAVEFQRRDGFIRNITRGAREDGESRGSLRGKLLWRPASAPGLSLKMGYMHFRREGGYYSIYARTDVPDFLHRRIASDNTPNRTNVALDAVSAEARYDINQGISLISETTWSSVHEGSTYDSDYGPLNLAFGEQHRQYHTFTEELRLSLDRGPWDAVLGAYCFDRNLASRTVSQTDVPTPIDTIAGLLMFGGLRPAQAGAISIAYGNLLPVIPVDFDGSFPTKVRTEALFTDLRFHLNDRISLLAGLRIDHYAGSDGTIQQATFIGQYPSPGLFGPLGPVIAQINGAVAGFVEQANADVPDANRSFTTLLPKAGVLVRWNEAITTAFVAQRGYRPGGLTVNVARGLAAPYDSEYIWNYEFSFRSILAGGRLRLDANAYYARWRNQQVAVNLGLNSFDVSTINAGKSHLHGFEIKGSWQISSAWSLRAAAGYSRTKFDQFDVNEAGITENLVGTQFAFAPHWTLSCGTQFRLRNGIAGAVSISHASGSFAAVGSNQSAYPIVAHTLVDARIGYDGRHWSAFVTAKNLFDDDYIVYKSPTESRAMMNDPRVIGLEFQAHY